MRGKKKCPKCGAANGPRQRICECGYKFEFKPASFEPQVGRKPREEAHGPQFFPLRGNTVLTPAGKCLVPWQGNLPEWVRQVQEVHGQGDFFSASALAYWLYQMRVPQSVKGREQWNLRLLRNLTGESQ